MRDVSPTIWAKCGKRPVEFILALGALVLLSPVLFVSALLMKVTSPGPVFFMQVRTGRDGREFRPYKLRTMVATRRPDPEEIITAEHPDVTAVGRVLRRLKIDELPQLLNVVRGEMSLVGPRPTLPEQTREYDDFQWQRLLVRPGLTGLAQVNGSTAISWEERIRYDVYYVRHHGFVMDAGIVLKTVAVILLGEERLARRFEASPYAREDRDAVEWRPRSAEDSPDDADGAGP